MSVWGRRVWGIGPGWAGRGRGRVLVLGVGCMLGVYCCRRSVVPALHSLSRALTKALMDWGLSVSDRCWTRDVGMSDLQKDLLSAGGAWLYHVVMIGVYGCHHERRVARMGAQALHRARVLKRSGGCEVGPCAGLWQAEQGVGVL